MKLVYWIYQTFIFLPIFLVASILTSVAVVLGCTLGSHRFWCYWPGRIWSWLTIKLLFLPVKVTGRENLDKGQSYIFAANHQSAFDIFLIQGFLHRNFKWMMKKSLEKIPFIGQACKAAHFVMVDKGGPHKIKATYDSARKILSDGMSVVVFPEGARTFTGHMGMFRRGAFMLADELQLPIAPITINGTFNVKPRMKDIWWCYWHPLRLTIHKPILPNGRGKENILRMEQESYEAVMSGMAPEYKGYVENPDQ